jgi:site-specific DNA recombinase
MTKRAISYARVSSDDRGKDNRNLSGQLEMCREYALDKGYVLLREMAEDDRGASGASFELEKLGEILEMAKNHEFDLLIVREIDRLSRNLAKQLVVEEELLRAGVKIEYVLGEYADTPEGNLMKHVRAVVAEYEREKIKERIQRGKRLKVKAGSVMLALNRPPFGYHIVQDKTMWRLEIYEPEAKIIRMMFDLYVNGDEKGERMTMYKIAKKFNELKIPTPIDTKADQGNGKAGYKKRKLGTWSDSLIGHYLKREVYKGKWIYGRHSSEPISVDVPAIVDPQIWTAAQQARKNNAIVYMKNRKHFYLFAKRIRCGLCSTVATGFPSNGSYLYYRCLASKRDEVANVQCNAPLFRKEVVEEVVWNWVVTLLNDPHALEEGLNAHLSECENQINPFRERLEIVENLISQNNGELDRLLDLYLSDQFPKDMLVNRKNELETAIHSLQQERIKLIEVINERIIPPEQIENIYEFAAQIKEGLNMAPDDFKAKRAIVDALDLRVILTVENGEKVVYAECALGEEEFNIEVKKSAGGGPDAGRKLRHDPISICAGCRRKSPRRGNQA